MKAKGGYRGRPAKKSKRINAAKATAPRASAPAEEGSEGADVPFSGRGEPAASAEEDIPVQAEQGFPEEPEVACPSLLALRVVFHGMCHFCSKRTMMGRKRTATARRVTLGK